MRRWWEKVLHMNQLTMTYWSQQQTNRILWRFLCEIIVGSMFFFTRCSMHVCNCQSLIVFTFFSIHLMAVSLRPRIVLLQTAHFAVLLMEQVCTWKEYLIYRLLKYPFTCWMYFFHQHNHLIIIFPILSVLPDISWPKTCIGIYNDFSFHKSPNCLAEKTTPCF